MEKTTDKREGEEPNLLILDTKEPYSFVMLTKVVWNIDSEVATSAAALVHQTVLGMEFMYSEMEKRNAIPNGFTYPPVLGVSGSKKLSLMGYDPLENQFLINIERLRNLSSADLANEITMQDKNGDIQFKGFLLHRFFLGGVEEMVHAIEAKQVTTLTSPLQSEGVSQSNYDAQDHEYNALKWQIYAASKNNMPQTTIDVLRNRLKEAIKVRRNR